MPVIVNNAAVKKSNGHITNSLEGDWETAIEAVDYPVYVVPAFFQMENEEEYREAKGITREGRDTDYHFVVTDPRNNGVLNPVASVTGNYTPISTKETYIQVRDSLKEIGETSYPNFLFISSDGAIQVLSVILNERKVSVDDTEPEISLKIDVMTGYDGTTKHRMKMSAFNSDGLDIPLFGDFNLARKHTKNIGQDVFAYTSAIMDIINHWDEAVNTLKILMNSEFNKEEFIDFVKAFASDSGMSEKHIDRIVTRVSSGEIQSHNAFSGVKEVSKYVSFNLDDKPQLQERIKEKMTKAMEKAYNKLSS
jgi:hypothetical protein